MESTTPEKAILMCKIRRRWSHGSSAENEWNRHLEGFAMPTQETSGNKRQIKLSNQAGPKFATIPKEPVHNSQAEISHYSSSSDGSADDDFNDVQPLTKSPLQVNCSKQPFPQLEVKRTTKHGVKRRLLDAAKVTHRLRNTSGSSSRAGACAAQKEEDGKVHTEIDRPLQQLAPVVNLSQQSNSSVQNYSISDYESQLLPSSEVVAASHAKGCDLDGAESASISSVSTILSGREPQDAKLRSSEWLKKLQWNPENDCSEPETNTDSKTLEDSAKKKRMKYCKGGLADRLEKLMRRKRSTQNIWNHRMKTAQNQPSDSHKTLMVELLDTRVEHANLVCQCRVVPAINDHDKRTNLITVLFEMETAKQLLLKKLSVVEIHPPWQTLNLPSGNKVILCTLFCRTLTGHSDTGGGNDMVPTCNETDILSKDQPPFLPEHLIATWLCPCSVDGLFPSTSCLAATTICDTNVLARRGPTDEHGLSRKHDITSTHNRLHTELLSQASCYGDNGILESIENQGGFGPCGIAFKAMVQRVFFKRSAVSSHKKISRSPRSGSPRTPPADSSAQTHRVSLLLQDKAGTCCELILPPRAEHLDPWRCLCEAGEGSVWSFTGLRHHCRTNKHRDPCLFQLIECVRPAEDGAVSASSTQSCSQQSQAHLVRRTTAQVFCYQLVAPSGESCAKPIGLGTGHGTSHRPSVCCKLRHFGTDVLNKPRVSIMCKVVFVNPQPETSCRQWYVIDEASCATPTDDNTGYYKLTIQSTCWLSASVLEELKSPQPVLFMKDITSVDGKGHYLVDGYSRVHPASCLQTLQVPFVMYTDLSHTDLSHTDLSHTDLPHTDLSHVSQLQMAMFTLPHITSLVSVNVADLLTFSGEVSGVNEGTAYTWEVCDSCQSPNLQPHPKLRHALHCEGCQKPVITPSIHISLEVYAQLALPNITHTVSVKVKLLQPTIEMLLPTEADDEGYDIESVLGKSLDHICCLVTATVRRPGLKDSFIEHLKEIHMREILLNT